MISVFIRTCFKNILQDSSLFFVQTFWGLCWRIRNDRWPRYACSWTRSQIIWNTRSPGKNMCYFYYVTVLTFFLHCFVTTVACFSVSFLCLIKEKESLFLRLSSFCLSFSRMPVGYFFTFVASCQVVSFFIVKLSLSSKNSAF